MIEQRSFDDLKGQLYLVPTPIGNLDDMTFRAVKILQSADLILAEDTRHTGRLLKHFEISKPMQSYHEHSNQQLNQTLVERLLNGEQFALVSDAGMPLINDPGHPLVQLCLKNKIDVIALPGANAALTALVASGLSTERFTYYGFFPRDNQTRETILTTVGQTIGTALFYESPYRIKQALAKIVKVLGQDTPVVIARELTKKYETYLRGTATEVLDFITEHPPKGEIVLLIEGGHLPKETNISTLPLKEQVNQLIQTGMRPNDAIKQVAKQTNQSRRTVYHQYHNL